MAPRTDERLLDTPMLPVRCTRCAATVRVRKGSWQQTSIQWDATAAAACEERPDVLREDGPNGAQNVRTCAALRESIEGAALDGRLPVPPERDDSGDTGGRTAPGKEDQT